MPKPRLGVALGCAAGLALAGALAPRAQQNFDKVEIKSEKLTDQDALDFHLNGDDLHVFHVEHAHTDGDAIIHFHDANVVHMGDTFFNGLYPFIDVSTGGSVDGMIAACDRVLGMVDARTRIIPGHGPLSDRAGLQTFRDMLAASRERVRRAIAQGKTLEQAKAAQLTADFDPTWGGSKFMTPERFVEELYSDLSRKPGAASGGE